MIIRLKNHHQLIDLQILVNKASKENKIIMKDVWKVDYHLVSPNIHHRNAAKRAICTFKAHFSEILSGTAK